MKRTGIINARLSGRIARLGHTDRFFIADAALPIPEHVEIVDLALVFGTPRFEEVLDAVMAEIVAERFVASEDCAGGPVEPMLRKHGVELELIPHEDFKARVADAAFVVRTGEDTAYANVEIRCGVPFAV